MEKRKEKSMSNVNIASAVSNEPDMQVIGYGDMWRLLGKVWSCEEGWMKSTKAMDVGVGCVVQVMTQQKNPDGSYAIAEAVTFVPGVRVVAGEGDVGVMVPCASRRM